MFVRGDLAQVIRTARWCACPGRTRWQGHCRCSLLMDTARNMLPGEALTLLHVSKKLHWTHSFEGLCSLHWKESLTVYCSGKAFSKFGSPIRAQREFWAKLSDSWHLEAEMQVKMSGFLISANVTLEGRWAHWGKLPECHHVYRNKRHTQVNDSGDYMPL